MNTPAPEPRDVPFTADEARAWLAELDHRRLWCSACGEINPSRSTGRSRIGEPERWGHMGCPKQSGDVLPEVVRHPPQQLGVENMRAAMQAIIDLDTEVRRLRRLVDERGVKRRP